MLGRGCKYDSTTRLYEEPGSIAKRNQKLACFIMVARCRNRECETVSRLLVLSSHTRGPAGRPAGSITLAYSDILHDTSSCHDSRRVFNVMEISANHAGSKITSLSIHC